MSDFPGERRAFSRAKIDLPVEIHQGGSVWKQRLIDISVAGVSTDQPDVWDAQYNEPFTLVIDAGRYGILELHAYLQHVEAGRLGFAVQHGDGNNVEPLRSLLSEHIPDPLALEADIEKLNKQ
ncbi:PilZ domain-containing protein [Congregibacter litoralis]|uniref:PilZ domain protein n=1 Tax=Congregibacter litoralis KT71 TaxID=314285 RepID=A4A6F0_9GAMM|nr:PilZ domain-containing protein [Congregibacter litoralis]EAQ98597.1 PilZ domain protein [Congregibacter litoralis KT71]